MSRIANPLGQRRIPKAYDEHSNHTGKAKSPGVYVGVVKKNDDPQYMGRLKVYIKEFGGDPELESTWISVSYASPFAGSTSIHKQGTNYPEYEDTIISYGFWAVPPDLDSLVLVAFGSGKVDDGYWFACLYQRNAHVNVPGIPAKRTYDGENIPAASKNHRDPDPDLEKYVTHKPLYSALKRQGLKDDPLRGLTSSSAKRETPSRVFGMLTPGQHQFVMDDGDENGKNRQIRLRTTNGTEILLDDVAGHIYLISKNGENWVEMSADGRIHVWGSGDISVRSEQNINLYADKDVNIEAGNNVNVKALTGSTSFESAIDFNSLVGSKTRLTSGVSSHINSTVAHIETAGVIHMNGPTAETADPIPINILVVNDQIITSICTTVAEHEPWRGHSGELNPVGVGNQQMQGDPAPGTQPREPGEDEQGSPMSGDAEKGEEVPVDELAVSEQGQQFIKDANGYTPVNVDDGDSQSVGFGTPLTNLGDLGVP
jgi:hypothetical protein